MGTIGNFRSSMTHWLASQWHILSNLIVRRLVSNCTHDAWCISKERIPWNMHTFGHFASLVRHLFNSNFHESRFDQKHTRRKKEKKIYLLHCLWQKRSVQLFPSRPTSFDKWNNWNSVNKICFTILNIKKKTQNFHYTDQFIKSDLPGKMTRSNHLLVSHTEFDFVWPNLQRCQYSLPFVLSLKRQPN